MRSDTLQQLQQALLAQKREEAFGRSFWTNFQSQSYMFFPRQEKEERRKRQPPERHHFRRLFQISSLFLPCFCRSGCRVSGAKLGKVAVSKQTCSSTFPLLAAVVKGTYSSVRQFPVCVSFPRYCTSSFCCRVSAFHNRGTWCNGL